MAAEIDKLRSLAAVKSGSDFVAARPDAAAAAVPVERQAEKAAMAVDNATMAVEIERLRALVGVKNSS
jgi:hypothetical protein